MECHLVLYKLFFEKNDAFQSTLLTRRLNDFTPQEMLDNVGKAVKHRLSFIKKTLGNKELFAKFGVKEMFIGTIREQCRGGHFGLKFSAPKYYCIVDNVPDGKAGVGIYVGNFSSMALDNGFLIMTTKIDQDAWEELYSSGNSYLDAYNYFKDEFQKLDELFVDTVSDHITKEIKTIFFKPEEKKHVVIAPAKLVDYPGYYVDDGIVFKQEKEVKQDEGLSTSGGRVAVACYRNKKFHPLSDQDKEDLKDDYTFDEKEEKIFLKMMT